MTKLVYLAGPITNHTGPFIKGWRQKIYFDLKYRGIDALSPLRFQGHDEPDIMKDSYEDTLFASRRGIYRRCKFDVKRCDIVLVNFLEADKISIGSCIELGWADAWGKEIVIAMEKENLHYHSMVRECAGWIVEDLDTACKVVYQILESGV